MDISNYSEQDKKVLQIVSNFEKSVEELTNINDEQIQLVYFQTNINNLTSLISKENITDEFNASIDLFKESVIPLIDINSARNGLTNKLLNEINTFYIQLQKVTVSNYLGQNGYKYPKSMERLKSLVAKLKPIEYQEL